jgi:hypothetical protein
MLLTVQDRMYKGIQVGKDLKFENRLRASSQSAITQDVGDMMDLKGEIVALKSKVFTAE